MSTDYKDAVKDPLKKILATLKFAAGGSCITSFYESIIRNHSRLGPDIFTTLGKHLVIWAGTTTAFTATVLILTNVRKKDDPWNYFFGASAGCMVLYSSTRLGRSGIALGLGSSVLAALLKHSQLQGFDPFQTPELRKRRLYWPCDRPLYDPRKRDTPEKYT